MSLVLLPSAMNEIPPPKKLSFRQRGRSFRCALCGVVLLMRSEHNAKIHLAATIAVCIAGGLLRVSINDWCWLVVAITIVWTAEALNTALEHLADFASPAIHPTIARAKDIAAGAVLLASLGALVIGVLILGPHLPKLAN